jgi:hypothetical protein
LEDSFEKSTVNYKQRKGLLEIEQKGRENIKNRGLNL